MRIRWSAGEAMVLIAVSVSACTPNTDAGPIATASPCGPQTASDDVLQASDGTLFNSDGTATGVSLGTRVYDWSFLVGNICLASATADNAINFRLVFADTLPANTTVTALLYYPAAPDLPPTVIALHRLPVPSYTQYIGQIANISPAAGMAGLVQAELLPSVQISFPTTGSNAGDKAFLQPLLQSLEVTTYYHPYVGNP